MQDAKTDSPSTIGPLTVLQYPLRLGRLVLAEPWRTPLSLAFGIRVALYTLIVLFVGLFPGRDGAKPDFWTAMTQWDGDWYLQIALHGYVWHGPTVQSPVAFFPLYPILGRFTGILVGNTFWGMLIVANVSFVLFLYYLYRLASDDFDLGTAGRAIVYAAVFPGAFVLATFYAESTAFALSVAAFYYARRGRWPLAIALGFLTGLTRLQGVAILLPLAYEFWRQRGLRAQALALGIIPLGLLGFGAYVWQLSGDPWAIVTIQSQAWFRSLIFPWETVRLALDRATWPLPNYVVSVSLLDAGTIILFCLLTLWTIFKMPAAYWLYALPVLLGALSQTVDPNRAPPTASITRFLMAIFPGYIALGQIARNPFIDQAVRWTFAVLMAVFAIYFFSRSWVL